MAHILIAEDDDGVRGVIKRILDKAGHKISEASNGKTAIDICSGSNPPDLIITDIIMPDKEGLETIKEIKSASPGIKIIAISGGGRIGPMTYLELAKKLGANGTLTKPFLPKDLTKVVEEVLQSES